ncbi:hypothetical protein [Mameliella sediminis]|uniref:hypothetical protein n=1 Tax=Mameliella sediminis TaxID=2836866 RepID=UPI001C45A648|nr:hypothetical protein [Mameliella sediminis]MBV7395710.1 hypothetical protein [Mameliella sediminis]MBY6160123.1 hypothetical protein [Mameliella alba]MBY6168593.1 hypothetical protein [Mameliella alba]MBY6174186.1 hypothetical protein [Mameliella alba]
MRFILAFVTAVAAIILIGAIADGDWQALLYAGPVVIVAGALLWRNLQDPEVTRRNGLRARVTFTFEPGDGVRRDGTYARVNTHPADWHVTLQRTPERGDMQIYDTPHRGWVWLGPDGLPERVKISYATTWKTWPVVSAAPISTEGPSS